MNRLDFNNDILLLEVGINTFSEKVNKGKEINPTNIQKFQNKIQEIFQQIKGEKNIPPDLKDKYIARINAAKNKLAEAENKIKLVKQPPKPAAQPPKPAAPQIIAEKKPAPVMVRTIQDEILKLVQSAGPQAKVFGEKNEMVEVSLNGQKYKKELCKTAWKLHISANSKNAGLVMKAIRQTLIDKKPFFKVIQNEKLLDEYNNLFNKERPELGLYKSGKLITIYPKSEQEALELALVLDAALTAAQIPDAAHSINHTDRPLGRSGFLWARHDQAGAPLNASGYKEGDHAVAQEGNYQVIRYYPEEWLDLDAKRLNQKIDEGKGMTSIISPDIFEAKFGKVHWNPGAHCFTGL